MKKAFVLIGIVVFAISCSDSGSDSTKPTSENATETEVEEVAEEKGTDLEAGKSAYIACAACHGQKAEGMKALNAPALANQEVYYLKQQINNGFQRLLRKGKVFIGVVKFHCFSKILFAKMQIHQLSSYSSINFT